MDGDSPSRDSGRRQLINPAGRPIASKLTPLGALWVSVAAGSFARTAVQLILSWITLEATGSLFMVGVVNAARMAPQVPLGIPAGILSDWVERRRLIVWAMAISGCVAVGVAALVSADLLVMPLILAVAVTFGALDTLRTTAAQAYAYDLVRASHAARGLAFVNLGNQLLGTAGGLIGGFTLERYGAAPTFLVVAAVLALGSVMPLLAVRTLASGPRQPAAARSRSGQTRPSFKAASTLVLRSRLVAVLFGAIVVIEILGFSMITLLPRFARDVFEIGAAGLGVLTATRSIGGVFGLLLLARFGADDRAGVLLSGTAALLGLALVAFASTPSLGLALVWLGIAGAAAGLLDTLGQMLLQRCVGERERGAAMGLWVVGIGFAPLGHLTAGALADAIGAPHTQVLLGLSLTAFAAGLSLYGPLRRMR